DLEQRTDRPNQLLLDTTIVAAWTAYLGGQLDDAARYVAIALADADRLRCDWNVLRAGSVAVATVLELGGPTAARSLLVETRLRRSGTTSSIDAELDAAEVAIL